MSIDERAKDTMLRIAEVHREGGDFDRMCRVVEVQLREALTEQAAELHRLHETEMLRGGRECRQCSG